MKKRLPSFNRALLDRNPGAFLLVAMFLSWQWTVAQTITVTGRVSTEETGESLPGVTVLLKGTTKGTITDIDGDYKIEVDGSDPVLIFSYVGFETREVTVNGQSIIDVLIREDTRALEEIVVIGYGTAKRVNLSGAVDQISSKDINSRPLANVAQGLQGVIPNLNVDFLSGEPGQAANINIRGFTSINGGDPLILIDGVPSDAYELNRLAPEDIESLSVIKDASAAAIYGARAAFGVILITTKTGSREGMNISFSSNVAFDKPTVLPNKVTDPYIYLRVLETSTDNTPWDNQNFSDQTYTYAKEKSDNPSTPSVRINPTDNTQWEYMGNRDWTEYFLDDFSVSQNYQLGLDGRSDKVNYYVSGAYNRHNGALKIGEDYFDRYSFRGKVDFKPVDWFTIGNNTFLTNTSRSRPTYLSIWDIYNLYPTDWNKNPDGTWANTETGHIGSRLTDGGITDDNYNSLQSRFTMEFSIWKDIFRLNADYTFRNGNTNYNEYGTKYKVGYGPDDVREIGSSWARRDATFENYNIFNIYGTFNIGSGIHNFTAIAGYNQEYYRSEWFSAQKTNLISSSLPSISLATGETYVNEYIADWAIRGAFYRLNYILLDRYIIEFNGRYDGTSKFPKEKRFGFFPSASAAWRVDQESFMSGISGLLSTLKLRGSFGSLGNQDVEEYGYIPTMQAYQSNYLIGGERGLRITPPPLVSPNYTWEEVNTINFGIDLGMMDDQFSLAFDIFKRNTLGMLTLGKELPSVLGAEEPQENAADLKTNGWELSLNYRNEIDLAGKPLNFDTRFIISDNRSYITYFDNPNKLLTQFYEGMELGEIWGLQNDGFFMTTDEIEALDESSIIPWGALSIVPGWPKYKDLDNDSQILKGSTVDDPKDLSVIGNITPRFRYGFNIALEWNGFDLRAFFQGVGRKDYYPLDYLYWGFYQQPYAGGYVHLLDYYRQEADSDIDRAKHSQSYLEAGLADQNLNAEYPILQAWLADRNLGERIDEAQGLAIPQTGYLLSGAYLRFKNLTFGYSLPHKMISRLGLSNFRVYFSGENLTEWSGIKDFFDPEAINDNLKYNPSVSTDRDQGKGYAYPLQRRYAIGVNLNF